MNQGIGVVWGEDERRVWYIRAREGRTRVREARVRVLRNIIMQSGETEKKRMTKGRKRRFLIGS